MAFEVVDKQPGGGTGKISIGQAGEATEIWTVVADGYDYSTEDLRNSGTFPAVYESFHAQNNRLRLQPIDVAQDEENPALFICTLTWTSDKLTPKEEEEKTDNPLDRKARITVKTGKMRETKHRDQRGRPKVNYAGSLFDPPIESNVSFKIITIRKNVTVFPDWIFEFDDAVNSVDFVIKGRTIQAGCAWIADIELGEEVTDGPTPYCEARIEIHVRKRRDQTEGELANDPPTIPPSPWQTEQLNEGLFKLVAGKQVPILVSNGETPSELVRVPAPVPLTLLGGVLDPVDIDNATYCIFFDHDEMDFNLISYLWSDS